MRSVRLRDSLADLIALPRLFILHYSSRRFFSGPVLLGGPSAPLDRLREIAQAAHTPWIANLTGASPDGNVCSHPFHRGRPPRESRLLAHLRLILAEAVADHSCPKRFLLPDRHAYVARSIQPACVVEVHDLAAGIRTEVVTAAGAQSSQSRLLEQTLDSREGNSLAG